MASSLFMMFDPGTLMLSGGWLSLKWLMGLMCLGCFSWNLFKMRSSVDLIYKEMVLTMWGTLGPTSVLAFHSYLGVFLLLLGLNLSGLVGFPLTAHPSICVSLAGLTWSLGVWIGVSESWKQWLGHFLPVGTPTFLWPMIMGLEVISHFIRPVTLAIRLTANIMTGHILLHLLMSSLSVVSPPLGVILSLSLISLFVLYEGFVSVLQAYIFTMLLFSYWQEAKASAFKFVRFTWNRSSRNY